MTSPEIDAVVAKLTKAQREAVLSSKPDVPRSYDEIGGKTRVILFRKGVFSASFEQPEPAFLLSELGLLVKARLMEGRET